MATLTQQDSATLEQGLEVIHNHHADAIPGTQQPIVVVEEPLTGGLAMKEVLTRIKPFLHARTVKIAERPVTSVFHEYEDPKTLQQKSVRVRFMSMVVENASVATLSDGSLEHFARLMNTLVEMNLVGYGSLCVPMAMDLGRMQPEHPSRCIIMWYVCTDLEESLLNKALRTSVFAGEGELSGASIYQEDAQ